MKKLLIIGLSLLLYANTQAQEPDHYLYFNAGGGLHNLSYNLGNGNEKGNFGYSFNAGYSYFFNKNWGLQTGIGLQFFKSEATLNYTTKTPSTDTDGTTYEYRTNYNSWKEKQQLLFLDIPLGLQYRYEVNEKLQLLAGAGVKITIPVKTTYKTTGGEIITSGFYSQWNVVLSDMPQHGFNNIKEQLKGDVSLKSSFSGFADLGALYELSPKLDLYAGCYFDYGLNNVLKSNNKLVYQQDGVYNGILASNQIEHARTVSLGLKVGVLWHLGSKRVADVIKIEQVLPVAEKAPVPTQAPKAVLAESPVEMVTPVPDARQIDATYLAARSIAASAKITFKNNSNQLVDSEDTRIKDLSDILKANSGMSLRIMGNTYDIKSQSVNYKLGLYRAGIVRKKFLNHGVSSSQLIRGVNHLDNSKLTNASEKESIPNGTVTLIVD